MNIQSYSVAKTSTGPLNITFNSPFNENPVVIVTPYWTNGNQSPVGHIETVVTISQTECSVTSSNFASTGYYINVLALDPGRNTIGSNTAIVAGSSLKTLETLQIDFPGNQLNSVDPATLLTPFWENSNSEVGFRETLDDSAASECQVYSGNMADNYYVQYVGVDLGITQLDSKTTLVAGIANKTADGTLRIYFNMQFSAPPTVCVSPWWNDANAEVDSIETVINVTTDYFDVSSANAGSNYFVNWIAVGASQ